MNRFLNALFTFGVFASFLGSYFSVSLIGLGTGLVLVLGPVLLIREKKASFVLKNPLLLSFLLLIAAILVSISLADPYPYQKPLGKIRYLLCFFLFCLYFVDKPQTKTTFLKLSAWVGGVLGLVALGQHFWGLSPLTWISGLQLKPVLGAENRFLATGFAFHHNPFAATLNFLFPFLLVQFLDSSSNRSLYGFGALGSVIGILCSFSRSGWLCLMCSTLVLVVILRPKLFIPLLLVGASAVFLLFKTYPPFQARASTFTLIANSERFQLWDICLRMFKDAPWFGQGFYSFGSRFQNYIDLSAQRTEFPVEAHNMYLDILCGTGVIGFLAFGFWLFSISKMLSQGMKKFPLLSSDKVYVLGMLGALIAFLMGGMFDKYFYMTQTITPFLFFLSMATSSVMTQVEATQKPNP